MNYHEVYTLSRVFRFVRVGLQLQSFNILPALFFCVVFSKLSSVVNSTVQEDWGKTIITTAYFRKLRIAKH